MYQFIPVTGNTGTYFGCSIYVRYKRPKGNKIELVSQSPFHQLFSTPDRDILFTRDLHANNSYRPIGENWDELLVFAPWSSTWKDFGIEAMLHNYTQYMSNPDATPRYRMPGRPKNDGMLIVGDSGGFQYAANTYSGHIDPKTLAKWYNGTVDVGVALDVPIGDRMHLSERAAKVQADNTRIMLDELAPNVEFMNALHGNSRETYNQFWDITHVDDRIKRVAISDTYRQTTMEAVTNVLSIIHDHPGMNQYHVLGILKFSMIFPIIRLATHRFKDIFITSDSSTPMQKALNWQYDIQDDHFGVLRSINIGLQQDPPKKIFGPERTSGLPVSINRTLSCSCPICSRVKYTDIFGRLAGVAYYLVGYHNMFQTDRYIKSFIEYSKQMDHQQYKEVVRTHLRKNRILDETMAALDYIEELGDRDPAKLNNKYKFFFSNSLFGDVDMLADDDATGQEEVKEKTLIDILDRFEKAHKGEKLDKHKHVKGKTHINTNRSKKRKTKK